jgi:hypothetical protein
MSTTTTSPPLFHPTTLPLQPRTHSWHRPLEIRMILPWIALISSFGAFYGISLPDTPGWEWWTLAQLICVMMVIISGIMATYVTSPFVLIPNRLLEKDPDSECSVCHIPRISGGRTHHCSWCNRCVDEFDHHCRWLNICVGEKNWIEFIALEIFSILVFAVQIAFAIYSGTTQVYSPGRIAGIVILSILPGVAMIAVSSSLGYQIYLRYWLGKTTHEYIKENDIKRGEIKLQRESKRMESRRPDIEKEQEAVRAEWLKQRNKEKQQQGSNKSMNRQQLPSMQGIQVQGNDEQQQQSASPPPPTTISSSDNNNNEQKQLNLV